MPAQDDGSSIADSTIQRVSFNQRIIAQVPEPLGAFVLLANAYSEQDLVVMPMSPKAEQLI